MNMSAASIRSTHPVICIKLGNVLSINKKVLHALNDPKNILFWWNKSEQILLIGSAPETTYLSFNIYTCYYENKAGFTIKNGKLIQTIMQIAGWRNDMIYVVKGEYISELDMVAFNLNDTAELKNNRPKKETIG